MKYLKSYREQSNLCNESIKDYLKPKSKEEIGKVYKNKEIELPLEIENGYSEKEAKSIIKKYSKILNSNFKDITEISVVDFQYKWSITNKITLTLSKYNDEYHINFNDNREYSLKYLKKNFFGSSYINHSDYQFNKIFYYFDHALEFLNDCNIDTSKIKDK